MVGLFGTCKKIYDRFEGFLKLYVEDQSNVKPYMVIYPLQHPYISTTSVLVNRVAVNMYDGAVASSYIGG